MGKCPTCGHKQLFGPKMLQCVVCGKIGCDKCVAPDFKFLLSIWPFPTTLVKIYACSEECSSNFHDSVLNSLSLSEIVGQDERYVDKNYSRVGRLFGDACLLALKEFFPQAVHDLRELSYAREDLTIYLEDEEEGLRSSLYDDFARQVALAVADNMVNDGRLLDAAKIFEMLNMDNEARELRERETQVTVKNVDVSGILNALLKQIKDGGLVVVYRCPHCSAPLRISKTTQSESLHSCEYCGSEIKALDVADFLRTALS